jgi:nitrogen fixation-related uncharacterized protein
MSWADHGKRPGPKPKKPKGRQRCIFEDDEGRCERLNAAHGLCATHAAQKRRGTPLRRIRPPRPNATEGFLWCGRCKQFRDEDEFGWDTTRDQPKRTCRPCALEQQLAYVDRNREAINLRRRTRAKGITPEQFEEMFRQQEGRCAICKRDRPLDIDHCHTNGHVRGLLCSPCNRALGLMEDDVKILNAAIEYLGA